MLEWGPWTMFAVVAGIAVVAAIFIAWLVALILRLVTRRAGWDKKSIGRIRRPFRTLLLAAGLRLAVGVAFPAGEEYAEWKGWITHALVIAIIAASGYLLAGIVAFLFARTLVRYPLDVDDNRAARRVHTQVTLLRRLASVVIAIVTIGAILLTFPGVEAFGASLLASAGLVSVVAGLAAQSTLSNVFAGLQLAFTDAIRVEDVVIVEGEWGRIEEITLTYIVVRIWDERRLVLPSTYFTTTPFENWTRRGAELFGTVEFDLDWVVSPAEMREHLNRFLETQPLWDRRSAVLQVIDATKGFVRVRITVTAANSGALWDLQCNVREAFVEWLHEKDPAALPRTRVQMVDPKRAPAVAHPSGDSEGMFSGSAEAEERQSSFAAAPPVAAAAEETKSLRS